MTETAGSTKGGIKSQIAKLGGETFGRGKEIRALPSILRDGESILSATSGYIKTGIIDTSIGMLVATNQRLFFLDSKMFGRHNVTEFAYNRITSINYNLKFAFAEVAIDTASTHILVDQVKKDLAPKLCEIIAGKMREATERPLSPATAAPVPDKFEQLEKLADLHERGALSETEFEEQKAKLLN